MTADQRLDQLEPLISQTLAVADRHTAQLKQLVGFASQQSDDIQFAIREVSAVKQEVGELKREVSILNEGQSMANVRLGVIDNTIAVMNAKITNLDTKLDQILSLLNGSK